MDIEFYLAVYKKLIFRYFLVFFIVINVDKKNVCLAKKK